MTRSEKWKHQAEQAQREKWWFAQYDEVYESIEKENEELKLKVSELESDLEIANVKIRAYETIYGV